jgi:hypothetical protein
MSLQPIDSLSTVTCERKLEAFSTRSYMNISSVQFGERSTLNKDGESKFEIDHPLPLPLGVRIGWSVSSAYLDDTVAGSTM